MNQIRNDGSKRRAFRCKLCLEKRVVSQDLLNDSVMAHLGSHNLADEVIFGEGHIVDQFLKNLYDLTDVD